MKRLVLMVGLVMLGLVIPWQLGYDPATLAATTDYSIGWTAINPTTVKVGQSAKVDTKVQARVAGKATVEASVRNAGGQVVWRQQWPDQDFKAWQSRGYTATWAAPATLPSGAYSLVTRVLTGGAAEAASRTVTFKVSALATSGAAPAATPSATAAPRTPTPVPPTATPAPAGSHPFVITGSGGYAGKIRAALDMMKATSPTDYTTAVTYVREIREGPNLAYVGSGIIQVSTASSLTSPEWAGGTIVHESVHVKNFRTGNFPYAGCEGEAKSLRAQAAYLRKVGENAMAQQVEALIGVWC